MERVLGKAEDAEASDPWGSGKIRREENFGVLLRPVGVVGNWLELEKAEFSADWFRVQNGNF